jgi:hypothetical protein
MDRATLVLQLLQDCAIQGIDLEENLRTLVDLTQLSNYTKDALLVFLCNSAASYRQENSFRTIIDYWMDYDLEAVAGLHPLTRLFYLPDVLGSTMICCYYWYPDRVLEDYLAELSEHDPFPECAVILERLEAIFPMDDIDWHLLKSELVKGYNDYVDQFIEVHAAGYTIQGKPEWMIEAETIDEESTLEKYAEIEERYMRENNNDDKLRSIIRNKTVLVKIVVDVPGRLEYPTPLEQRVIDYFLSIDMSPQEKTDIVLADYRRDLINEKELFRVLGPCNPVIDVDLSSNTPCCRYGGCRMFTCNEFETEYRGEEIDIMLEGDILPYIDWYTGYCSYCLKKIQNRFCAVRQPLVGGGWRGCYCSWNCVERNELDNNELMVALIEGYIGQLLELGIYDMA